jgi:hypothetical protein
LHRCVQVEMRLARARGFAALDVERAQHTFTFGTTPDSASQVYSYYNKLTVEHLSFANLAAKPDDQRTTGELPG